MKKHSESFINLVEQAKKEIKVCSVKDLEKRLKAGEIINLIDVREDSEWAVSRIPSALHIGKGIIERDIELYFSDKSKELVLYCGGGYRSALAAQSLKKMGYTNVVSMEGGFREWTEEGLDIDK